MRVRSILLGTCLGLLGVTAHASGESVWNLSNFKAFQEPGVSMEPAIGAGEVVYVDMSYFQSHPPKVGQIVLYTPEELDGPTAKRIVAIGPSTVEIKHGTLIVDGDVVPESYLKEGGAITPYSRNWGPVKLPTGCIFLLGDYRDKSLDGRTYSCVTAADLLGLVKYGVTSEGTFEIHKIQ